MSKRTTLDVWDTLFEDDKVGVPKVPLEDVQEPTSITPAMSDGESSSGLSFVTVPTHLDPEADFDLAALELPPSAVDMSLDQWLDGVVSDMAVAEGSVCASSRLSRNCLSRLLSRGTSMNGPRLKMTICQWSN